MVIKCTKTSFQRQENKFASFLSTQNRICHMKFPHAALNALCAFIF